METGGEPVFREGIGGGGKSPGRGRVEVKKGVVTSSVWGRTGV